jgi:hypothetical protein
LLQLFLSRVQREATKKILSEFTAKKNGNSRSNIFHDAPVFEKKSKSNKTPPSSTMKITFKASQKPKNSSFKLQETDPIDDVNAEQYSTTCFPLDSKRIFLETSEGVNHFVNTAHRAFCDHHGFALYPDHI